MLAAAEGEADDEFLAEGGFLRSPRRTIPQYNGVDDGLSSDSDSGGGNLDPTQPQGGGNGSPSAYRDPHADDDVADDDGNFGPTQQQQEQPQLQQIAGGGADESDDGDLAPTQQQLTHGGAQQHAPSNAVIDPPMGAGEAMDVGDADVDDEVNEDGLRARKRAKHVAFASLPPLAILSHSQ